MTDALWMIGSYRARASFALISLNRRVKEGMSCACGRREMFASGAMLGCSEKLVGLPFREEPDSASIGRGSVDQWPEEFRE